MPPRSKNNIAMVKFAAPKRLDLPGGRTFQPKYRRVTKTKSTSNVTIKRRYKKRKKTMTQKRNKKSFSTC